MAGGYSTSRVGKETLSPMRQFLSPAKPTDVALLAYACGRYGSFQFECDQEPVLRLHGLARFLGRQISYGLAKSDRGFIQQQ